VGSPTSRLLAFPRPVSPLHEVAFRFTAYLAELERRLRRSAQESPSESSQRELSEKLFSMLGQVSSSLASKSRDEARRAIGEVREILGPWFWRSELWGRAFHKPHGYAGDFVLLDRLDAIAAGAADDPLKPVIVACLDRVLASLEFARALRDRRAFLTRLLLRERFRRRRPLSILDVAPRGARHVADYFGALRDAGGERVTIVDDDPSVLAYFERVAFAPWKVDARAIGAPLHRARAVVTADRYDVILVSTGLESLDDDSAREDLATLSTCLSEDGVLAAVNLHPADSSRPVREWLLDWPCYTRTEDELARLFPERPAAMRWSDSALSIAVSRRTEPCGLAPE